ncbi:MAG TPA: histidinol-phosphatase HisJ family protein [Symbiobacteriaceae bacterium]|nr:histidinol-phosphatase HisJ family protein [Symbiobacteriaceae bacterium]
MLKNLVDYHTHTVRCGHAEGTMEEYVEAAIAAGLKEFGFSDHLPFYWSPEDQPDPTSSMARHELEEYVADVLRLRDRYREIPIRLGIEADYVPGYEEDLVNMLAPYPWDYVIGSVHIIGDWDFDNPAKVNRYADWDISELYAKFFTLEIMAAKSGLFDVLAHIDLIKKFGHRPSHDLGRLYADVAETIAKNDVAIELSTAGLRKPVREVYPNPALLKECCDRGVPLILSSDCHAPGEVAWGFAEAANLARQIGFTRTVRFEGRRRIYEPL